jgi:hypothetical protein
MKTENVIMNQTAQPHSSVDRLVSIGEVRREYIPIGHTKIYALIGDGSLKTVKIGRRTYVRLSEIDRFISTLASNAGA